MVGNLFKTTTHKSCKTQISFNNKNLVDVLLKRLKVVEPQCKSLDRLYPDISYLDLLCMNVRNCRWGWLPQQ